MKIGIGLPATIPGTSRETILEWAKRAETTPLSALGIIDRVVYPNYEPLLTLAAAGAVTQRIRLMTTILVTPLRSAALLAKELASLDALCGGRLSVGIGVGGREDDYQAAEKPFHNRGKRLDEQLVIMKRIWSGEPVNDEIGPVGPPPAQQGGPELLIGGASSASLQRVGELGDGFLAMPGPPDQVRQLYQVAQDAWKAAGRPGKPRLVGSMYYSLGPEAERGADYILDYYAFAGPAAEQIAQAFPKTPDAIKGLIQGYSDIGMDEVIFWPTIANLDQIDRLVDLIE